MPLVANAMRPAREPAIDGDDTFSDDVFSCQFVSIVLGVLTNSVGQDFNIIM